MLNIQKIKEEICDIGRRIYNKGFASANDGNISYRIDANRVVCTPTQICKGFMKPDDLCVVDMEGNQISGVRKRTSEIFLHLTIMKEREDVKSVVHCHPLMQRPSVSRVKRFRNAFFQKWISMGDVPIAKYAIPGGQDFADTVLPFIHKTNIIVQANHGMVSFGPTVERPTGHRDSRCLLPDPSDRTRSGACRLLLERRSRRPSSAQAQWGFKDPRADVANCEPLRQRYSRDS